MKWKKAVYCGLGLFSLGFLGGCSSTGGSDTGEPIRIMAPVFGETAPEDDSDIQQKLEELTGHEIDITWIPDSSYGDRLSIVLAGDDVPDILVSTGGSTITSGVANGAFWQLDDYIDQFEYLSQMDPNIRMNASFNGDTFGIYRSRDVIRSSVIIRRDWLENLGLEAPTTIDEFTEMLIAFRDEDPTGTGEDTYGLIIPKWDGINNGGPFDIINTWFGVPNRTTVDEDGNVIFDFMTDEYMEALEYLKMLFDEDLINRDFAILPTDDWNNDFINGRAGVIIDTQSRGNEVAGLLASANDVEDGSPWVTMIGNITTDNADAILPTDGFNGHLMIPVQSVQSEERLLEVLDFIDKLNSEEVHQLLNLGIEGVHWQLTGDGGFENIQIDDEALARQNSANRASFAQLSMGVAGFQLPTSLTGTQLETERISIRDGEEWLEKAVFNPTASLTSEVETTRGATLGNIIADARVQFISGQIDQDEFLAEVERWKESGGNDVIAELTELYQENMMD